MRARASWLLWIALGALWLANLPLRPLFDPDEGRYAEIPREMLASGDWVTPSLNGLKYLEKPPLQYWGTAALYATFGVHTWTARLWPALLSFLCIPLVYLFTRRLGHSRETGLVAAALLAINPYFVLTGQLNLLDQGFCLFLAGALFAFALAQSQPDGAPTARNYMLVTWACLALAVLSKGVAALVLPGATLFLYMLATRDWARLKRLQLLPGVPLFLAIAAPWFWQVQARNPEFAQFFFVREHFARFLTNAADRVEPWWYFLAILLFALLPVIWNLRHWDLTRTDRERAPGAFRTELFLLIWCAVVLVFFSISHSKLASYLLPLMPPLAVLLARSTLGQRAAHARATATVLGLLLVSAVVLVANSWQRYGFVSPAAVFWGGLAWVVCIATLVALRRAPAPGVAPRWIALAAASIAGYQALFMCYAAAFPARSGAGLAAQFDRSIPSATPLYAVGQYRHSLSFYLRRTFQVYDYLGELEFGLAQAGLTPATHDRAAFLRDWQGETQALAFIDARAYPALSAAGMPGRIVVRDGKSVVVSRS